MEENNMMTQEINNQQVGYQPPANQYLPNPNGNGYYPVQEYGYPAPPAYKDEESSARNTLLTLAVGAAIPTIIVVGGKVYKLVKNHFLKQANNQQRFAPGNNGEGMYNQYTASQAGQQFQQPTVPQQPMQPMQPVYTNVDAQAQQMRSDTIQAAYQQQPVQNVAAPVQNGPVQQ